MAFKTTYSQYDNKTGLFSTEGTLNLTTIPSNENKITASDGAASDSFGTSVAVGNGRIVVGAYGDNTNQGSAYIFNLAGTQLAKITASDGAANDNFGNSVAVNNGRIVVGAPYDDDTDTMSGSAYIFNLNGTQLAKITSSDPAEIPPAVFGDNFGISVAVGNGRIVVGAPYDDDAAGAASNAGAAHIFDLDGTQLAKITASDGDVADYFGYSVAVGNGRIVVGAYGDDDNGSDSGSAYIFDLDGNQLAKIKASDGAVNDQFGTSVAVGNGRIVVGALYDGDNGTGSGSAYIFNLSGTQLAKITASDGAISDQFGSTVAVGNGRIVVGARYDSDNGFGTGSAYIFDLDGTQLAKITASDGDAVDFFGKSVAIGNGRIVVGASGDEDNGSSSGSAYIYETPNIKDYFNILE